MRNSRTWWIGFAAFSAAVLGALAVAGVVDRSLPGVLVGRGGVVSPMTDWAWRLACLLAAGQAVREARGKRSWRGWALLSALAAFAAWEETESIGGRETRDLHNAVIIPLAARHGTATVAGVAVALALAAARLVAWVRRRPAVMCGPIAPHALVAAALLGVALLLDTIAEARMTYVAGFWPLEEACELLAAVAVLGAPVRALAARPVPVPGPAVPSAG